MYKKGKAIVVERPRKAVVKEIKLPEIDDKTVVIKTTYSAISSGTEMKVWGGLSGHLDGNLWYPLVPGYEEVGEVVHVGENAPLTASGERLKVGDRVMANEVRRYPEYCAAWGGQVEYAVKSPKTASSPSDLCARIPDNVSYQEAVVTYLACVAMKGIEKVGIKEGETVLVIGTGNIGLSALQLIKLKNAGKIIAMDNQTSRLALAKKYTEHLIDASKDPLAQLKDMTEGRLADVVFECSGNSQVVQETCHYLRKGGRDRDDEGGRIHLQGDYPSPIILYPYSPWFCKNLSLSMTCAVRPGYKECILGLISEGKFDAKSLYTKECHLDDAPKAYEELEKNRYDILKILFKWGD
ncbi:MAG: zinc-binding dehydrogenase [bacterium]